MQPAPRGVKFKDRFFEGLILLVIGLSLWMAAIGMVVVDDTSHASFTRNLASALALGGVGAVLLGMAWARRTVELSEAGLLIKGLWSSISIPMSAVASLRIRQELRGTASDRMPPLILSVRDTHGRKGKIVVGIPEHSAFVQDWIELACAELLARWRAQLAAGQVVNVSKHVQLIGTALIRKRKRIELDQPFDVQEVPATSHGDALLTITAAGQRMILEANEENHPVLRRFILGKLGRG